MRAMKAQYALRHRSFLERQSYKVQSYKSMEYDEYDNPSSVYLIYESEQSTAALGVSRLTPVTHRSMLRELFPDMVKDHTIFSERGVWEGTRFCIERNIPPKLRRQVLHYLVGSYFEFGFTYKATKIIGMMPTYILRSVFKHSGCEYETLGEIQIIDGQKIQAACMDINPSNYQAFIRYTGLIPPFITENQLPTMVA